MLFVALFKGIPGAPPPREIVARRAEWQYPEGVQLVGEYWPQTADPAVISIFEADSIAPITAAVGAWNDIFDITVVPAVTAEEGLELTLQRMQE